MKKQTIILVVLLMANSKMLAQTSESLIKDIRYKYRIIKENQNSYDTTMTEIWGESTEGGHAIAYYDSLELKMIYVLWAGEMGKRTIEYYYDNDKLFFTFAQDFNYNRPIYWDENRAKEIGDSEFFDPQKTVVIENRYYFYNEKLFRWLNNTKEEVDLYLEANLVVGQNLIAHSNKMKGTLGK